MSSRTHLKEKAFILRKSGKSYSEILKILNLSSKGTLSHWFKNIKLNAIEQKRLEKNMKLAMDRGLHKFNKDRTKIILDENIKARSAGSKEIKKISKRELMLIGGALYWGEGTKAENIGSSKVIIFTNSDPSMIAVFMKFIREIWSIQEIKIRAGIHIYPTINPEEAKKYWSKITKLPAERFYIVTQVSRASQSKRAYNLLPYGTVAIKINNRKLFFRIKGMIQGMIESLIN